MLPLCLLKQSAGLSKVAREVWGVKDGRVRGYDEWDDVGGCILSSGGVVVLWRGWGRGCGFEDRDAS